MIYMLNFFTPEPVTIIRKNSEAVEDAYGNPVYTEENIETSGLIGLRSSNEVYTEIGSTLVDEYKLFLDNYSPVTGDRFVIRGEEYILDGNAYVVTAAFASNFMPMPKAINIKRMERNYA